MLRITIQEDERTAAFKLEGKLANEWVAEAQKAWLEFASLPRQQRIVVDLCGVSFVDDAGRDLLGRMHADGARLIGTGPMSSALIEEICEQSRRSGRSWTRSILGLLFLLLATVAPRIDAAHNSARRRLAGQLLEFVPEWTSSLQSCATDLWKGLFR